MAPLTTAKLRRYELLLTRAREQSMLVVAATTAATATSGTSGGRASGRRDDDLADCALIEREIDALLAEQEHDTLAAIDRALRLLRHEPEIFGRCEECGEEIPREWLDVAPWLSHCAEHARGALTF